MIVKDKTTSNIYGVKLASSNTFLNPNIPKEKIVIIKISNTILKALNGLHNLYNNINPVKPVKRTQIVEVSISVNLKISLTIIVIKTLATIVSAAGRDLLITFGKKCPVTLSLLGSSAKMNDGIPIVTTLVKVS